MMVTMYLKGPMKASKRLSPLTAKALGRGRASRHTTLAAGITGAGGWLGGKGCPEQAQNLPTSAETSPGPEH